MDNQSSSRIPSSRSSLYRHVKSKIANDLELLNASCITGTTESMCWDGASSDICEHSMNTNASPHIDVVATDDDVMTDSRWHKLQPHC